ncbi:MAG: cysteine--tRNA ligase [Candidatus Omnitrophica bacterium]|nr:cysteine--tRNA ligase [Candidatus Omnitrophota bacterium]HOX53932.1 cysteine--tRNA ligase [Candidatus Omnitrophota bacterium]
MSVQIYNTLTKKKKELAKGTIKMYTCGVTVYDVCHIGHARSLYIFDVIVRYLKYRGYKVKFVRNITDIDDKIINKAKELNLSAKEVAEKYTKGYYEDLKSLSIGKADFEPKATENISDMIKHIQGLIKEGYAYVLDGDVYFSVRKFKDYGKLSGQNLEQIMAGARIEKDDRKQDPLDFALWKKSKEGEPSWKSPWGDGRPGWHIECSVMSLKYLKTKTLDIHAGGLDLVFPHHENEIAQAEALTGKPFAKHWIHHGLLTINGQKMAKSLGNFVTIQDFINNHKDVDFLKLFFLSTHYSNPVDYNLEKIEEAKKHKKSFDEFFDKVNNWGLIGRSTETAPKDIKEIGNISLKFQEAMEDNFNTPQALACLFSLVDLGSKFISQDKKEGFLKIKAELEKFFFVFGLKIKPKEKINSKIVQLTKERDEAKKNRRFEEADSKRKEIEKIGYAVIDTANSVTLKRL